MPRRDCVLSFGVAKVPGDSTESSRYPTFRDASIFGSQCFQNQRDCSGHLQHKLMRDPENTEAESSKPFIPTRITSDAAGMTAPVHIPQ